MRATNCSRSTLAKMAKRVTARPNQTEPAWRGLGNLLQEATDASEQHHNRKHDQRAEDGDHKDPIEHGAGSASEIVPPASEHGQENRATSTP